MERGIPEELPYGPASSLTSRSKTTRTRLLVFTSR